MSGTIQILEGISKVTINGITGYACGQIGKPAMIVLQEWWGVTDKIQRQAMHISSKGYRTVIPDLYKGKLGVTAEEANHMMTNLDFPQAVEEIKQTAEFLKQEGATKIGVTGFCMGGALTIAAGVKCPDHFACGQSLSLHVSLNSTKQRECDRRKEGGREAAKDRQVRHLITFLAYNE